MRDLYRADPVVAAWWAASVECGSAVARLDRDGHLSAADATAAFRRLDRLARRWHEIQPGDALRETARRFLRTHPLRAGDSLQLAAAFLLSEQRPSTLSFICLDDRLARAAEREGFEVVP